MPIRPAAHFGEHMVLQRQQPITLWGRGTPGMVLHVDLAGARDTARVADDGRWRLRLPAMPAGGPHRLLLSGAGEVIEWADVWIGDVWLCGGQSNMAWPLAQARHGATDVGVDAPLIRHLRVPNRASLLPAEDIAPARWVVARPGATAEFSAVAWYFARRLQAEPDYAGVPIGLINVAWNGSNLEAWVRRGAVLEDPAEAELAVVLRGLPTDPADYATMLRERVHGVVRGFQPGLAFDGVDDSRWHEAGHDHSAWPTLQAPQLWESQGLPGLDGVVWYRRTVDVTAAQAAGASTLHLAKIDDCDESYVNGRHVGGLCHHDTPRRYELPMGLLHVGANNIAVKVTDLGGGGGFHGDAAALRLDTAAGSIALAGRWHARVAQPRIATEPQANDAPSLAHNGLVHPLAGLGLRGMLWYQGESNVVRAASYAAAFQRLIVDWRAQFTPPGGEVLPFFFAQLAAFQPLALNSLDHSPWAELRDAQRQALALPRTGMAVTTDVGDADDIHPRDKRSVGERLALLALHDADPRYPVASGPVVERVERAGTSLLLHMKSVGGLATRPAGAAPQGFAVAGANSGFVAAQAEIDGQRIRVWHPLLANPVAVRYGWVDNPARANVVDGQGLPASPWRSDQRPLATAGQRYAP